MPAVGRALINRSFKDSVCGAGGCGVGVDFFGTTFFGTDFFGAAFFVTFGAGGVTFFFTRGGVVFFGGLFTAGAPTLPLRPSIMIFPSWV